MTDATAGPDRAHEWAEVGTPLRERPVHAMSWEYDL